jgi:hypothetical protein
MQLTASVFEGWDTPTLRRFRSTMLEMGKLTLPMNAAIDAAIEKRPKQATAANTRNWCDWRSNTPYTVNDEARGMDDYYSDAAHANMLWLMDQHPSVCADMILEDGYIAYYGDASKLYFFEGLGVENGLFEVWTEAVEDMDRGDGNEHVAVFAKRIPYGRYTMRGEGQRIIDWLAPHTLLAYYEDEDPYEIAWDSADYQAKGGTRRAFEYIVFGKLHSIYAMQVAKLVESLLRLVAESDANAVDMAHEAISEAGLDDVVAVLRDQEHEGDPPEDTGRWTRADGISFP